jgi:hypothetical protein
VATRRSAIWWFQAYGWTAYGLSVYLAMLPALRPGAWFPMLGIKALRTGLGLSASLVLVRLYDSLRGRQLAVVVLTAVAASTLLGGLWLVVFEVSVALVQGASLQSLDWTAMPRELIDYAFVLLAWSGAYLGIGLWQEAAAVRGRITAVELESLRYQINPHFLFNALNSIRACVPDEATVAREMINDLSRFLRHILTAPHALVPLSQECAAVTSYLAIEQRRFAHRLRVAVNVEPAVAEVPVPAFLLHTLAENAITHGLPGRTDPMDLRVSATAIPGGVSLEIANTGALLVGAALQHDGLGVGLDNVRGRLERLYPGHATLALVQDGPWVKARIELPVSQNAS